ncbi:hypothetical protein V7x_40360 [Crateriforma conspicua]|uniref:Uncharacterized protein n=1 Tax=Crateriforma conspicua TaxID=2527996 RepID=A0A5C6FJZ6_9PLAN|nr:hypothetical protein V7x_40360 [Crateriforma conspicua]
MAQAETSRTKTACQHKVGGTFRRPGQERASHAALNNVDDTHFGRIELLSTLRTRHHSPAAEGIAMAQAETSRTKTACQHKVGGTFRRSLELRNMPGKHRKGRLAAASLKASFHSGSPGTLSETPPSLLIASGDSFETATHEAQPKSMGLQFRKSKLTDTELISSNPHSDQRTKSRSLRPQPRSSRVFHRHNPEEDESK